MRKYAVVSVGLALVMLLTCGASAQTSLALGLKAGLNLGNLSFSPEQFQGASKSMRTGFGFGGVVEMQVSGPFYIQFEPMYLQGGTKFEQGGATATFKEDFFELPILAKVKFPAGGVTPFVFAGPNFGANVGSKVTEEFQGQSEDTDLKDSTESLNVALDFGAGLAFDVAPTVSLGLDARYSVGLTNISKATGLSIKTSGIGIFATALFKLP